MTCPPKARDSEDATLPARAVTRVAVGIPIRGQKVWIQLREQTEHLDGFWEFPGGKIRPAETAAAAVKRELEEETGFRPGRSDLRFLRSLTYHYPSRTVELHFFLVRVPPGTRLRGSGQWVEKRLLAGFKIPPANQEILDSLIAEVEKE